MIRIRLLGVLFVLLSAVSCSYAQKENELSPAAVAKALSAHPDAQLVDVRTPEEYEDAHIDGALNIDWYSDDFEEEINKLDKTRPVYVYCKSGKRSAEAADKMKAIGFTKVYTLKGGIVAWEQAGLLKPPAQADDKE